jgi:hypothetical protein
MKIAVTWDYELFFGDRSGTVEKCMVQPTAELLRIAEKHGASFTFFVDTGFLVQSKSQNIQPESLHKVEQQILSWQAKHETALHIHPHWEDALWENNKWIFDLKRYKLADFTPEDQMAVVQKYFECLQHYSELPIVSYRAGGWCIQPFEPISETFKKLGIRVESSVFQGGKNEKSPYQYDFTSAPNLSRWRFETNPCSEVKNGFFEELPISAQRYSPLFFWKLFVKGRLRPDLHKPIGDGIPVKGGGSKKDFLTRSHWLCVSADGFYVTKIQDAINRAEKLGQKEMVIIGHPKACTVFSLQELDKLLHINRSKHSFVCLRDL